MMFSSYLTDCDPGDENDYDKERDYSEVLRCYKCGWKGQRFEFIGQGECLNCFKIDRYSRMVDALTTLAHKKEYINENV